MKANDMTDTHARSASMAGKSPIYLDDLAVGDQFKTRSPGTISALLTSRVRVCRPRKLSPSSGPYRRPGGFVRM